MVDDNPATLYATSRVARAAGFDVLEAETGYKALDLLSENPEVILLDVRLPDLSGYEVCKRIRQNPEHSTIPVIHISATHVTDADKVEGLESGADAYLTHPVDPAVLTATIQAFVRTRKAEADKQASDAKFRAIFDQSSTFAFLMTKGGLVMEANRFVIETTGMERTQFLGKPIWELSFWANDGNVREAIKTTFEECMRSQYCSAEFPCMLSNGEERVLSFHFSLVMTEFGEIHFVAATGIDITDRKRAEADNERLYGALIEGDRRKDEFLATLAHELRNPLAPLRNGLEIWRVESKDGQQNELLNVMNRQVDHLVRLVDDLLDISRISRGKVDLRLEPISLRAILQSAVETCMPLIDRHGQSLSTNYPNADLTVNGDFVRLSQVFTNLLNNAAKYTPQGGSISINHREDESNVWVEVSDSGIGIEEDQLSAIFDLFVQVPQFKNSASGGLGIGLTLVKNLVELHGGSVSAASEGIDKGTSVTVKLPLGDSAVARTEQVETESRQTVAVNVLVIDDSVDNAKMLARVISLEGHDVQVAHSGKEGIDLALKYKPALAFVDIGLPDMTGREVAARLRESFKDQIFLIALTGYGTQQDKELSRMAGFDRHVTKPATLSDIASLLREASI